MKIRSTFAPGRNVSRTLYALVLISSLGLASCGPLASIQKTETSVERVESLSFEQRLRKYIPETTSDYLGKSYVYGAKGPNAFDCSGFTSHVLRQFDIMLMGSSMGQAKQGRAISPSEAQPGDLVYFANSSGQVNHVAIVVANGPEGLEVIHATTSRGVVRDNITTSSYWAPRLAGARCVVDCKAGLASNY